MIINLAGFLKAMSILVLDYSIVYGVFQSSTIAFAVTAGILFYVFFGGYLALFREGGIFSGSLPATQKNRLQSAASVLIKEVHEASGSDISRLRIYLIPGDDNLQASAYGLNCISVSRGALEKLDPMTLNAVLAHEIGHILRMDPEVNRAVFATIVVACSSLSVVSFITMIVVFLLFFVLNLFRSWLGLLAFHGTTKVTKGFFGLLQKVIASIYLVFSGLFSRAAEYQCDRFSASLGYGHQLTHFLTVVEEPKCLTLTDVLYKTHPSPHKRIARLESYINNKETQLVSYGRKEEPL